MWWNYWFGMKKKKQRLKNFTVIGSMLQEQMIAFGNGKSNRIRGFTSQEIEGATNGFTSQIVEYVHRGIFKGNFENIPICVKKNYWDGQEDSLNYMVNDIVIASRMSIHKNVLKLVGVCLETKFPIAVYEWAEHGSLEDCLLWHRRTPSGSGLDTHQQQRPLPWKLRLKIAAEVADVVVYLHTAFSRPIIHRNIKASSVLLDQQNVAKLCDFSLCIPIPEGEVRVEDAVVAGTIGYIAPEYLSTCSCSEKADVFSFGILLLVLLTAQPPWDLRDDDGDVKLLQDRVRGCAKDNRLADIVDPRILGAEAFAGSGTGMNQQLERFAELALSCAADREEDRPEMIDVAKQLWQMEDQSSLRQTFAALSFPNSEGVP